MTERCLRTMRTCSSICHSTSLLSSVHVLRTGLQPVYVSRLNLQGDSLHEAFGFTFNVSPPHSNMGRRMGGEGARRMCRVGGWGECLFLRNATAQSILQTDQHSPFKVTSNIPQFQCEYTVLTGLCSAPTSY